MSVASVLNRPVARRRARSRLKRLLFPLFALLLAGLVLELVAYAGYWIVDGHPFSWSRGQALRASIVSTYDPARMQQRVNSREVPHPYLGFVRNPDRLSNVSQFGYPRSTPLFTKRSKDTYVIAVVGGSVAFHFAKKGMPLVMEALSRSPEFAGRKPIVVNLAVGGYKEPQQLMTLNYLLVLGFEFDAVVNLDGFNEVALYEAENGRKSVFPIYPRAWYIRAGEMPDARMQVLMGRIAEREARIASCAAAFSRAPWRFSVTANLVWQLWHLGLLSRYDEAVEAFRDYRPAERPYRSTGPRVTFPTADDLYEHLAQIWQRSSLQLDRLCRANGIRYYHFLQPNQYVPGSKPLAAEERKTAYRENQPYREGAERGYPLLVDKGRELAADGVRFVDLTRLFEHDTRVIYEDDCCHMNALGNRLIAEEVAQAMLADPPDG